MSYIPENTPYLPFPIRVGHNNPLLPVANSEDIKGALVKVANMAELYALYQYKSKLIERQSIITVLSDTNGAVNRYELIDGTKNDGTNFLPGAFAIFKSGSAGISIQTTDGSTFQMNDGTTFYVVQVSSPLNGFAPRLPNNPVIGQSVTIQFLRTDTSDKNSVVDISLGGISSNKMIIQPNITGTTIYNFDTLYYQYDGANWRRANVYFPHEIIQSSDGTVTQIADNTTVFIVDPATVLASFTPTFSANMADGQTLIILFGGQIAVGNTVINAYQDGNGVTSPLTVYSGESLMYKKVGTTIRRIA